MGSPLTAKDGGYVGLAWNCLNRGGRTDRDRSLRREWRASKSQGLKSKGSKPFLFLKKKQKTFTSALLRVSHAGPNSRRHRIAGEAQRAPMSSYVLAPEGRAPFFFKA